MSRIHPYQNGFFIDNHFSFKNKILELVKQKLIITMSGIALLFSFQFLNATVEPASTLKPVLNENRLATPHPLTLRTMEEFLSLTPKKYKELTGKRMTLTQKVSLKLIQLKMKRQLRIHEAINSFDDIDFRDPVDKWMWFWIFAWGIGLVILFLPGVWVLSSLFFLVGLICLIVWLVKKFS